MGGGGGQNHKHYLIDFIVGDCLNMCYLVQLFVVPDTAHTYNAANNANADAIFFLSIVHLYETNKTTFSFDMFIVDDTVYHIYICIYTHNKMKCTLNHGRGVFYFVCDNIILYYTRNELNALTFAHTRIARDILFGILYCGIKRYIIFLICPFFYNPTWKYVRKCIILLYYTVSKYRCRKRSRKLFCFPLLQRCCMC